MLGPDPGQLDVHPYPDDHEPIEGDTRRVLFAPTVLGLWETPSHFRQGNHVDEVLFEDEPKSRKPNTESTHDTVPLEVFQQLGLLYYKKFKRGEELQTEGEESKYAASNYVLVSNVYDDSIWVIWNSRPMNQETGDRDPAKDDPLFQRNYAVFPGTECDTADTIIYAKVAQSWDSLGFDKAISFTQVRRRTQNGQIVPEPLLVYVHWTRDGGLRRENDFRSMAARRSGDS